MQLIGLLAPYFERYITINGLAAGRTYNYAKRGFKNLPVLDITLHRPKCTPDSWLYVAVRAGAQLATLAAEDKLYVGSQTADRMFRGDGMKGVNFHHAQMRAGNGDRNLESYVRAGGRVDIHQSSAASLRAAMGRVPELAPLSSLVQQPTKHIGYWLEQAVLALEPGQWQWNTSGAEAGVRRVAERIAA